MEDYYNTDKPLFSDNPTFRSDFAAEEMDTWCLTHCDGKWEVITPDHIKFEFLTDANRFRLYFWDPTVSFDV